MKNKLYSLLIMLLAVLPLTGYAQIARIPASIEIRNGYIGLTSKSTTPMSVSNASTTGEVFTVYSVTGLDGTDFKFSPEPKENVILNAGYYVAYNIIYTPTTDGATEADIKISTSLGDFVTKVIAHKDVIPAGPEFESFEGKQFPPIGWTSKDFEKTTEEVSGGDYSTTSLLWGVSKGYLESPRLDLTSGAEKLVFDYRETYPDSESDPLLANWETIELKVDENDYVEIWSSSDIPLNDSWARISIDLSQYTSDNAYLRFVHYCSNPGVDVAISSPFWDNIVLPTLHGKNLAPVNVTNPTPQNGATKILYGPVKLSWVGALFADNYKLVIGTDAADVANNVGIISLGNVQEYVVPDLLPGTEYFWKVIASNANGDAENALIWSFKTQPDATIYTLPYEMNFNKADGVPAAGWSLDGVGVQWSLSTYKPYEGDGAAYCRRMATKDDNTAAMLVTPPVILPDEDCFASFVWCNNSPGGAGSFDGTGTPKDKDNDVLSFEVQTLGSDDWTVLAQNVSPFKKGNGWTDAKVSLAAYNGKTVRLRWKYFALDAYNSNGASVDKLLVGTERESSVRPIIVNSTINVYPTKTTGLVNIDCQADVDVYTISGSKVISAQNTESVDLSDCVNGMYILKIKAADNNTKTVKVVKY